MAHFAEINEHNTVVRVLVIPDEQQHRGQEYLANDLGLGGVWIQTEVDNSIRGRYAGIGDFYDDINDVFIETQPYPSWTLDENFKWQAPVARPEIGSWYWDEAELNWVEIII